MTETTPIDCLIVGHITADLMNNGRRIAGGTVSYAVRTAHAFGLRVGVLTSTAPDEPVLQEIAPYAQVISKSAEQTTTFENVYTPSGRIQYVRGFAAEIYPNDIPENWRDVPLVHIAPIAGEINYVDIVKPFAEASVLLTLQGWLRQWGADEVVRFKRWHNPEIMQYIDFLVYSEEDIVEAPQMEAELAEISQRMIVTQAENGGKIYHNGTVERYQTRPVEVVNQTGAGDVFATSLLCAYHRLGDIHKSLKVAAYLGADAVTRVGLDSCPSPERVEQLLSSA